MQKTLFGLLFSVFTAMSGTAFAAEGANTDKVQVADNAPDSYVVKRGDTLWAISGKFLKQPWRWPEVWRMNKDAIHNPHLIYPGQTVYLDRNGPTLSLGENSGVGGRDKLSPQVYAKDAESPITSISLDAIKNFLEEPLVSESGDERGLPSVIAIEDNRVAGGPGNNIFAKGVGGVTDQWSIYRRGQPIRHPENKEILGYEAMYVGNANTIVAAQGDTAAELKITNSQHEASVGDRLTPAVKTDVFAYAPHAPAPGIRGVVTSLYGSVGSAGRYSVISFSLGKNDGIEPGHVVAVNRSRHPVVYKLDGTKESYKLPEARSGLAFVFRVFNRLSYALVMDAVEPVNVGDAVVAP
ncbi:LysM peptidoglycan-binding domain-containing protein [Uliginosibacterium gangwonense]|uniref:LysM peptidoglycan-binding domain-containing protein n=1 Tax=Uliginosibacterium gangwonense TaxID=392736 RepID=UPI000477559F|nr:LysM peptidoglycan-binding domain-containing protein [Uliginosibacterium gangwonense]